MFYLPNGVSVATDLPQESQRSVGNVPEQSPGFYIIDLGFQNQRQKDNWRMRIPWLALEETLGLQRFPVSV